MITTAGPCWLCGEPEEGHGWRFTDGRETCSVVPLLDGAHRFLPIQDLSIPIEKRFKFPPSDCETCRTTVTQPEVR